MALLTALSNKAINTDALRHPRAVRAPGASRRLPLRYAPVSRSAEETE
jgi:hypothetical protein